MRKEMNVITFEVPSDKTEKFVDVLEFFGHTIVSEIIDPGADGKDYITVIENTALTKALNFVALGDLGINVI